MESPVRFDLIDEPWLPVRLCDGTTREVGVGEALIGAHTIAGLDIEFPSQEPALLRLLLAVCYRALEGPVDDEAWESLWTAERLPKRPITEYLDRWRERFDLFHPVSPFFQTPGLEPAGKDGVRPASKLIAYAPSGNNVPIFTPITDAMSVTLRPAEAARWLVERHAWGTASDKTGAMGNPRVKDGRDTPAIGHLGWIGFVAPVGRTLKETLLLNLVPWSRKLWVSIGPDDLPAWERPPTGPERKTRPPDGTTDLFTWQGRRIRLYPERRDGEVVVARVLVCAGDDVQRDAIQTVEPHTGWRMTKEKDGSRTYQPNRARVGQQVWRGLSALLALDEQTVRAGVLSWLGAIEECAPAQVSLLVTAAEYGTQSTTLADFLSDRLDTAVAILRRDNLAVATLAVDAASFAEDVARALASVAAAPFLSADDQGRYRVDEGKRDYARVARRTITEELYGELDAPFRSFVVDLATTTCEARARSSWAEKVSDIAWAITSRNLARLSATDAYLGAMAESWFLSSLARARATFSPRQVMEEVAK
ncbi:MAG: type I-E CRISPR-associated protein Cse1/CasA [Actinomycetota bacterium]|nr:type I-E CRISPR-associated protein Cse1/CasA [Actinomycetota bacterium]